MLLRRIPIAIVIEMLCVASVLLLMSLSWAVGG
jgi:hypothetical protein